MTSQDETPSRSPASPALSGSEPSLTVPKTRSPERAVDKANRLVSEYVPPSRRSNPSLSALFASTSRSSSSTRINSVNAGTPAVAQLPQSVFSPGSHARIPDEANKYRELIVRSFVPHVAVLPSADTEELLAQKGFTGGFLELVRPYGENVQGKVTIRDGGGSSRSWEDFAVRFTKLKDGLESPRMPERTSTDKRIQNVDGLLDQYFPASSARLRTGGDVPFIEDAVDKHLSFSEAQSTPDVDDYFTQDMASDDKSPHESPFHLLYLRRLLSGLPLTPHETFSHPVACVIVITSRSSDPIEELRQLYANTNSGDQRLPQWVNNEYLRYYVLVHDEEQDDVQRSTLLFEQMKRHFGLHCHLLRLRSDQCVPSDDDCDRLPVCEWLSASEELAEIQKREVIDDMEDNGPWLFDSDAANVKSFVREMVTQSIVPLMERLCATWNDQVASRRRGISGRFLSLSKKWTPFGSSSRNSSSPLGGSTSSSSNYDSLQGFYRPDAPEAIMRKLADYAFMLRDFKLAYSTYDLLRTDYSNDKAWKYYAGANEMSAITALINSQPLPTKSRTDGIDQMLEAASYSYTTRCAAPFNGLRTLAVGAELLLLRGGSSADDAARWASRITELDLVGPIGHAIFSERTAACYATRQGTGSKRWGSRRRKSALWSVFATEAWLRLEMNKQAEKNLQEVFKMYNLDLADTESVAFDGMRVLLEDLRDAVAINQDTADKFPEIKQTWRSPATVESVDEAVPEKLDIKKHRTSLIGISTTSSHPLEKEMAGMGLEDERGGYDRIGQEV